MKIVKDENRIYGTPLHSPHRLMVIEVTVHLNTVTSRVGTGCSGQTIFGPPNQSGKIFGRSVEFGWSLVVPNKRKFAFNEFH